MLLLILLKSIILYVKKIKHSYNFHYWTNETKNKHAWFSLRSLFYRKWKIKSCFSYICNLHTPCSFLNQTRSAFFARLCFRHVQRVWVQLCTSNAKACLNTNFGVYNVCDFWKIWYIWHMPYATQITTTYYHLVLTKVVFIQNSYFYFYCTCLHMIFWFFKDKFGFAWEKNWKLCSFIEFSVFLFLFHFDLFCYLYLNDIWIGK